VTTDDKIGLLLPDWPAPVHVHAISTTRLAGVSQGCFASLNLADHVGDDPAAVAENRQRLAMQLGLPAEPVWLQQVHGSHVIRGNEHAGTCADGAVTRERGRVCCVLTADCLPLLLCDRYGKVVGAVHAGWRGILGGVIESAIAAFDCAPADILAWLGPAIGPRAFEVGEEVRARFVEQDAGAACAFTPKQDNRWLADIYQLARQRLHGCGIESVWGGDRCTYSEPAQFYSYRRDGITGRMASLIWLY